MNDNDSLDDGDPREYMPDDTACDERCIWCGAEDHTDPGDAMNATMPIKMTIYARVNDSEVLNEIAVIDTMVEFVPITDENRQPGDAWEAEGRIENYDLAAALRAAADNLGAGAYRG